MKKVFSSPRANALPPPLIKMKLFNTATTKRNNANMNLLKLRLPKKIIHV